MGKQVTIPPTVDDAIKQLNGLGRLLTATEWERAAIVAAFVVPEDGRGRPSKNRGTPIYNVKQFTDLGITGLRDHGAVTRYLNAWASSGLPRPRPGATVQLPTRAFREVFDASKSGGRPRASIEEIAERASADKSYARKLVAALDEVRPEVINEVALIEVDEEPRRPIVHPEHAEAAVDQMNKGMRKALHRDRVVQLIEQGAETLAEALHVKNTEGITDEAGYEEAMRTARRVLYLLDHDTAVITEADRTYLDALGIAL